MIRLALLLRYAESLYGVPYIYGGNNPVEGFDCSGLVCEILRAGGMIGKQDYNSQMLFDAFQADWTKVNRPVRGTILFFGKGEREISHCAFGLGCGLMVECGGGDSSTITREAAAKKGAFVRPRPVTWRKDLITMRLPAY